MRGSLVAYQADQRIEEDKYLFNVSNTLTSNIYCKLLLATKTDVMKIVEREKIELGNQLLEDENAPEKCFIEEAINLLSLREIKLSSEGDWSIASNINHESNGDNALVISHEDNCEKLENMKVSFVPHRSHLQSTSSDDFNESSFAEDLDISHNQNSNQPPAKIFYFYQGIINLIVLNTYQSIEYTLLIIKVL